MDAAVFAVGAYDAVYLFKTVIERDGVEPQKIRAGLENIPEFKGLVKHFTRPVFTRDRHNAVTEEDMVMTRWTNGKMLEIKYDDKGPYVDIDAQTKKYLDKGPEADSVAPVTAIEMAGRRWPARIDGRAQWGLLLLVRGGQRGGVCSIPKKGGGGGGGVMKRGLCASFLNSR